MTKRKGIIMAGGSGSRMNPITNAVSKHLLQVYDKPMIYYPISTLMLAGIREILIISTPEHIGLYKNLIKKIGKIGVDFKFHVQEKPKGIAHGLILAEKFLNGSPCALILGDNLFYGNGFSNLLHQANKNDKGAYIFSYKVKNPNQYGVVKFDRNNKIVSIIEKPKVFISNFAVTGLYFYDSHGVEFAKKLKPSNRGELEITDLNLQYIKNNALKVISLNRGFAWLDTGTPQGLLDSANFIATIEKRQGIKISCLEEIALHKSWINITNFKKLPNYDTNSEYGKYLINLADDFDEDK